MPLPSDRCPGAAVLPPRLAERRSRSCLASALSGLAMAATYGAMFWLIMAGHMSLAVTGTAVIAARTGAASLGALVMNINQLHEESLYVRDHGRFLTETGRRTLRTGSAPVREQVKKIVLNQVTKPSVDYAVAGPGIAKLGWKSWVRGTCWPADCASRGERPSSCPAANGRKSAWPAPTGAGQHHTQTASPSWTRRPPPRPRSLRPHPPPHRPEPSRHPGHPPHAGVRHADHIYVLNNGHIAEHGTHDELVATRGRYAAMFDAQAAQYAATTTIPRRTGPCMTRSTEDPP